MGLISSRQHPAHEADEIVPAHVYKYPPKSGSFFGCHFMMGGERFEVGQTEGYLFGENSDLNFLGAKPVQFPYPQNTSAEPTRPLCCSVAIRRDSLKFIRPKTSSYENGDDVDDQTKYNIEFVFDCDTPCTITVYYFATEECTIEGLRYISKRPELTSKSYQYDIGANQLFSQTEHLFNPSLHRNDELAYNPNSESIPVVIHCVAESADNGHGPQSHSTLAVVERSAEGQGYILKPLKQKLYVDGVCYLLQEIYGIENKNVPTTASASSDQSRSSHEDSMESGAECVVCMSDLRDTLILPCRHLCLCSACAETLRYKASNCPICRSPFRALLQIKTLRKIRAALASNLPTNSNNNNDSSSPSTADMSSGHSFLNRYEQVPLIEALNGPVECPAAITLPHLPAAHTAPASLRISPRAPPRRGHSRKKTAKYPLPIQEVLTPQTIQVKKAEDGEYVLCTFKHTGSVDGVNNPYLPGQADSDDEDDAEVASVTCGTIVQKPELESAVSDDEESDSSYRTPMAEKRMPRMGDYGNNEEDTFHDPPAPVFRLDESTVGADDNNEHHSYINVVSGDFDGDSDTNNDELPMEMTGIADSSSGGGLAGQMSRDETPLSSFSVSSGASSKPLLLQKSSTDIDDAVLTVECEKL